MPSAPAHLSPSPSPPSNHPSSAIYTIPATFQTKKRKILAELSTPPSVYTDKSPKGSVDTPIIELIDDINSVDGLVTTSSCSGRVSVFVEGPRGGGGGGGDDDDAEEGAEGVGEHGVNANGDGNGDVKVKVKGGPGGKRGGKWLFVSHDANDPCFDRVHFSTSSSSTPTTITEGKDEDELYFTRLCGLTLPSAHLPSNHNPPNVHPRLIHLSFSPLILHILTATLSHHARPLLSAAINAGFRESGVQSLAVLDHHFSGNRSKPGAAGTMVAIRTAGIAFDTVIGRVVVGDNGEEKIEPLVGEEYLRMCFGVVRERFRFNEGRKERLRREIGERFFGGDGGGESDGVGGGKSKKWEGKEERAQRKREDGLRRKKEQRLRMNGGGRGESGGGDGDPIDAGLGLDMT